MGVVQIFLKDKIGEVSPGILTEIFTVGKESEYTLSDRKRAVELSAKNPGYKICHYTYEQAERFLTLEFGQEISEQIFQNEMSDEDKEFCFAKLRIQKMGGVFISKSVTLSGSLDKILKNCYFTEGKILVCKDGSGIQRKCLLGGFEGTSHFENLSDEKISSAKFLKHVLIEENIFIDRF